MLSSDVVIEYCGQEYRIPWLLVGSARSKLTDRVLSDELKDKDEQERERDERAREKLRQCHH